MHLEANWSDVEEPHLHGAPMVAASLANLMDLGEPDQTAAMVETARTLARMLVERRWCYWPRRDWSVGLAREQIVRRLVRPYYIGCVLDQWRVRTGIDLGFTAEQIGIRSWKVARTGAPRAG